MAESLSQHLNIRIKLFHEKKMIFKIKETNKDKGEENLLRELGTFKRKITFNEFERVQEAIEVKKMEEFCRQLNLTVDDDYVECLDKLINAYNGSDESKVLKPKDYVSEMPIYYTLKKIAHGGFARTHVIRKHNEKQKFRLERVDVDQPNLYILKLITFPNCEEEQERYRTMQRSILKFEILVGQKLSHPNICEFYDAFKTNYFAVQISEFLCLGPINVIIQYDDIVEADLHEKRLKFYTAQLLMVLEYLHALGIYHGNLSAFNICIDYRGYLKLIDFGIAFSDDVVKHQQHDMTILRMTELYKIIFEAMGNVLFENDELCDNIELKLTDKTSSMHLIDLYMIAALFRDYAVAYAEKHRFDDANPWHRDYARCPKAYIAFWILDPQFATPSASEIRRLGYYDDINFTRLLLRDYDLVTELKLDCEFMFTEYMKETSWLLTNEDLVFHDDNEYTFKKKNDLEDLKLIHGKHYRNFHDL